MYRAEPKEPTQFGSVSGSEIQNLPFSHSGIVSLYRPEPKEPTSFGSASGSEIKKFCIGLNLVCHINCNCVTLRLQNVTFVGGETGSGKRRVFDLPICDVVRVG